jgi:hypothetical protein
VVGFTPRPLYSQGKNPWYPLDRRLGGPQSRSGRGDEKNSQLPPGFEHHNTDRPARSPALYRLSYHGFLTIDYTLLYHMHVYIAPSNNDLDVGVAAEFAEVLLIRSNTSGSR